MELFESFGAVSTLRKDERESQGSVSSGPGEEVILFDLVFVSDASVAFISVGKNGIVPV